MNRLNESLMDQRIQVKLDKYQMCRVAMVVGSSLARGDIFTASIGLVDSLYPAVFIYCMNLHQFLILCCSKAMMFVKLHFRTSDIYLFHLDPSGFHLRTKQMPSIEKEPI